MTRLSELRRRFRRLRRLAPLSLLLLAACPARRPPTPPAIPRRTSSVSLEAQILWHEDHRNAADGFLLGLLASPEVAVRRRALLALGRIGDPASLQQIAPAIRDAEPTVRAEAAFAVGEIGDPKAESLLKERIQDPEPSVRFRVIEALTKTASPAARKLCLAALMREPDTELLARVVPYTFRFGDPAWVPFYLDLAGKSPPLRHAALYALSRLLQVKQDAPIDRAILDAMQAGSEDGDPAVRAVAARNLGLLPKLDLPERTDRLRHLLFDPSINVRVAALHAYQELFRKRGLIWHEVRDLADDRNASVRLAAFSALAASGGPEAERILRVRLRSRRGLWRRAALDALFAMGPEFMDRDLSPLVADPDFRVRAALARDLGAPELTYGTIELAALLEDQDARVRPLALASIARRRLTSARAALDAALVSDDVVMRATAADAIAGLFLGSPDQEPPVGDAGLAPSALRDLLRRGWKRSAADKEGDARLAIVRAFEKAGMTVELADALHHPDYLARREAARLLHSQDPVAPLSFDRAPASYQRLLDARMPEEADIVTTRGTIRIRLFRHQAPLTCENFVRLARRGFYDGLAFHRIVPGFVVQGGCPRGDGNGGPGYTIRCEINQLPYRRGTIGMALAGKDTGGSQFFITLDATPHLDGGYTVFGEVLSGMEVVESLDMDDKILRVSESHSAAVRESKSVPRIESPALSDGQRPSARSTTLEIMPHGRGS